MVPDAILSGGYDAGATGGAPMQVRNFMTAGPTSCRAETSLSDAARLMIEHDCGALPVVEGEDAQLRLVGMITDRDIATRAVAARMAPDATTVGQIMSHPIVSISDTATVDECVKMMGTNKLRRMPVVDQTGLLVGIVAQADLANRGAQGTTEELVKQVSQGFGPGTG